MQSRISTSLGAHRRSVSKHLSALKLTSRPCCSYEVGPFFKSYLFLGRDALATLVFNINQKAQRISCLGWTRLAAHRHLLHQSANNMTIVELFRRKVIKIAISLPDLKYRKAFEKLTQTMQTPPTANRSEHRAGVLMMIGTLGPGGAERQAVMTASGLVKRGYENLRVICTSLQNDLARFYLQDLESIGVRVSDLNTACQQARDELDYTIVGIERVIPSPLYDVPAYIRAISQNSPSVVHLWLDEVNVKAGIAAVILRVPRVILGLRSLPPCNFALHQPYMREAYRWLAKQPGVVLVNNSRAGARAFEQWLGIPENSIHIVHNGFYFDTVYLEKCRSLANDYRELHGLCITKPVIGTVIRLTEEKRPLLWLEIAAQVRRRYSHAQFLVVGDGPLRSDMELRAAQEDLKGAVAFVGHEKKPLEAMAAMDIFLLTSRAEGLPNVLIEAQAVGVPVVTTNAGGASETLRDKVTGWVLEKDDSCYAADIIIRLIKDEKWRNNAKLAMFTFVSEAFSLHRMLNETEALYDGK